MQEDERESRRTRWGRWDAVPGVGCQCHRSTTCRAPLFRSRPSFAPTPAQDSSPCPCTSSRIMETLQFLIRNEPLLLKNVNRRSSLQAPVVATAVIPPLDIAGHPLLRRKRWIREPKVKEEQGCSRECMCERVVWGKKNEDPPNCDNTRVWWSSAKGKTRERA